MSINIPTSHRTSIKIPYGDLRPIVEWCERNCVGDWRYMEDPNADMYSGWVFFFEEERDYMAFMFWNK